MNAALEIIDFWFVRSNPENWFASSNEFDKILHDKYFDLHQKVALGEAFTWRTSALGRLAEIIVLDQFSRQFYRSEAKAFANDAMALVLAQQLVAIKADKQLDDSQRMFAYMPYMHSESLLIHDEAVRLYEDLGNQQALDFEIEHQNIIKRYGRFPKRNTALGRNSNIAEKEYISGRDEHHF